PARPPCGARSCELSARTERCAAPLGGPPLGACAVALALAGRHRRAQRGDQADARRAAPGRAAVLGVGAPEIHAVPVPVRSLGDLPAAAEPGARAPATAGSADQGVNLSCSAGSVLSRDARSGAPAPDVG